jgi:Xaa-Pro aminopeptidase
VSVHAARRDRLRALVADATGSDVLLVTHLPNVQYLTGFSGSNAVLAVGSDGQDLFGTDGRYVIQAAQQVPDLVPIVDRDTLRTVVAALGSGRTVAVESTMTLAQGAVVDAERGTFAVADGLVERLRAVKDDTELAALERACAITSEAIEALAGEIRVGDREVDLARRLEQLFGELGADDRSFETIVGSGPNSAIGHHEPGPRRLAPGDLIVVDAGALVDGYHADMTRTFVVGEPDAWQVEVHDVVLRAQTSARERYRDGADLREVDAAARDLVADAGHAEHFDHGLGHGVGLEIHEPPFLGPRSTGTMSAGMAITVEPGVYLPGRGGVRIEDTLVVTPGGPRVLTPAARGLRVVG